MGGRNMLILTRRPDESLLIGGDVRLTVLGIKGGQVRLGIEAPREIAVHREEILKNDATEEAPQHGEQQVVELPLDNIRNVAGSHR